MINVYSGDMIDGFQDNGSFLSPASALNLYFANQQMGGGAIFTCKGSSVAIFTMDFICLILMHVTMKVTLKR